MSSIVYEKTAQMAMEMDEERKARLENMVATTQLRLALETEEERRAKKKEFGLRLEFKKQNLSRNKLAHPVMGTIFLVKLLSFFFCGVLYLGAETPPTQTPMHKLILVAME